MKKTLSLVQPEPTKQVTLPATTITCRVCERAAPGNEHAILLCPHCLADVDTAARNVANSYAAAVARINALPLTFKARVEELGQSAWWSKVEDARATTTLELFAQAWAAAKAHPTRSQVCAAYEQFERDYSEALVITGRESERYRKAEPQLDAARALGYGADLLEAA